MVKELLGARAVRDRQQLESLVVHLVHAATVFPLGKAFLKALFATKAAIKPGQIGRLNLAARSVACFYLLISDVMVVMSILSLIQNRGSYLMY